MSNNVDKSDWSQRASTMLDRARECVDRKNLPSDSEEAKLLNGLSNILEGKLRQNDSTADVHSVQQYLSVYGTLTNNQLPLLRGRPRSGTIGTLRESSVMAMDAIAEEPPKEGQKAEDEPWRGSCQFSGGNIFEKL